MRIKILFNLLFFIGVLVSFSSCGYNGMVQRNELVSEKWAQVENVYQRRADLIPNLVNTVKGDAEFQKSTLTDVIKARSEATSIKLNVDNLTPENIQKFQQAQDGLSTALNKLMVVYEKYPELNTEGFRDLRVQLEGCENRIAMERSNFNKVTKDYNTYIKEFPNNFLAGWYGFHPRGYFTAKAGADVAPTVQF